ncbi:MAG: 16S rRNA (uracil(1498)-N(3))-methyltransferase [Rickettsiales bacterium]
MAREIRLYTKYPLIQDSEITLEEGQSHYLANVMRLKSGDNVSLFNGKDGQWLAKITLINKKHTRIVPLNKTHEQTYSPDLWLVFAPIKGKTELVAEKATELGVSKILPVITEHTIVRSLNSDKIEAHIIGAAQQCEMLNIPELEIVDNITYLLDKWDKERILLYGDESGGGEPLLETLINIKQHNIHRGINTGKSTVLIGPEGGFSESEFMILRKHSFAKGISMGPRVMKADTAAVAALSCVQSVLGDWDKKPRFISEQINKNNEKTTEE